MDASEPLHVNDRAAYRIVVQGVLDERWSDWMEGMRIVGTPEYRSREEVIVFLRALPDGGYRTYAMAQGHFEVLHAVGAAQPVVVRDTRAITMARWVNGQMSLDHGQRAEMPLAVFLQYVRELAASSGGVR